MMRGGLSMPKRTENAKKNNKENKKNDIGRPHDDDKEIRRPPVFENDNGLPLV